MMGYPHTLRAELRKALRDAGIKYWVAQGITFWNCADGRKCLAYGYEDSDGTQDIAVKVVGIRDPQQAIDMTVGAGTCHFKVVIDQDPSPRHRGNICECDKCGYRCARGFIVDERFKCCPNCGKRIEVGE